MRPRANSAVARDLSEEEMKKRRLMTPGPTEVPPDVLLEMARPVFHHRTDEYKQLFKETTELLQYVFRTANDVITLASSGTGAIEAAVTNLLAAGDKALVARGGKFGDRPGEICEQHGVEVVPIDLEWGDSVTAEAVKEHLERQPDIAAVFTTLCETSTGAETDIQALGRVTKDYAAVLVVDGISSVGAVEMPADDWGVDVLLGASQKALMVPPGLAFLSVSEKAWKKIETTAPPAYYFDLLKARKKLQDSDTPYTPGITLVRGLRVALGMIKGEGIENVWQRHRRMAEACRAGVQAMGLEILPRRPSAALTVVKVPDDLDGAEIPKLLESRYGIKIAGGQEKLKGKIFRIAHMGYMDQMDVVAVLSALEMVLNDLGFKVEPGAGVAAAEKVLMS